LITNIIEHYLCCILKKRLQHELGEDNSMKQQAKYLALIRKAVEQRISSLKEGGEDDWNEEWQNYLMSPGVKLHNLSLNEILKDSVAMSYFLDYMNSVGGTNHLLLFLNTHGIDEILQSQHSIYTLIKKLNLNQSILFV